jgi:hypothetical protein
MPTAGARALREDDNELSREAVLLQWERKIEAAERRDSGRFERRQDGDDSVAEAVSLRPSEDGTAPRTRRFERRGNATPRRESAPVAERRAAATPPSPRVAERHGAATAAPPSAPVAERRTITIAGQPAAPRRRRPVVEAQLAQPDRIALWAFLLGLFLVAVAAGTAHA